MKTKNAREKMPPTLPNHLFCLDPFVLSPPLKSEDHDKSHDLDYHDDHDGHNKDDDHDNDHDDHVR